MNENIDEAQHRSRPSRNPSDCYKRPKNHEEVVIAVEERQMSVFLLQHNKKLQRASIIKIVKINNLKSTHRIKQIQNLQAKICVDKFEFHVAMLVPRKINFLTLEIKSVQNEKEVEPL